MTRLPIKMPNLPAYRAAAQQAADAEQLRSAAAATVQPEVLLGLSFYARAGDEVRQELASRAVAARREYAPVVAVLSLMMDGIDEASVLALIRHDPDNALGHYLHGALSHVSDRRSNALAAFRQVLVLLRVSLCPSPRLCSKS